MSDKMSWEEFIQKTDPKGIGGMTAKKFREMVLTIMIRALSKARPTKNRNN